MLKSCRMGSDAFSYPTLKVNPVMFAAKNFSGVNRRND